MASAEYWKGASAHSQSQSQLKLEDAPSKPTSKASGTQPTTQRKGKGKARVQAVRDSDDEHAASSQTRETESGASQPAQRLFIPSEDEHVPDESGEMFDMNVSGDEDEDMTLRSAPPKTQPPARKSSRAAKAKAAPIIVDDDSDDGATFKGFGAKRKRR